MTAPAPVEIVSFGYGHGAPPDAHVVVDVRHHFKDPHVDPALRYLTAADPPVMAAVLGTPGIPGLVRAIVDMAHAYWCAPRPGPLTIAIGCVGGRHRSAAVAIEAARLLDLEGARVRLAHRDLSRAVIERSADPADAAWTAYHRHMLELSGLWTGDRSFGEPQSATERPAGERVVTVPAPVPLPSVADALAALAAWIDERLDDELADRQFIAEQASARAKGIMRAVSGGLAPVRDLVCEITLPGLPESVRQFRALARQASATPYQAEAAALCVSELATNAILHSHSGKPGGTVTVCIAPGTCPRELRISVTDCGAWWSQMAWEAPPLLAVVEQCGVTGYGLGIVDTIATDWGVTRAPGGSCTWCDIPETADQASPVAAVQS